MLVKVSYEEFWKEIIEKELDVIISLSENFPYKNTFKFRDGRVFGYIQDEGFAGLGSSYYLNK